MDPPETQYVAVGDADVAYQVVGDSSLDLLYCFGLGSHIEMAWDVPRIAEFLNRLAVFSRLVFFDRRGTGRRMRFHSRQCRHGKSGLRTSLAY